MFVGQDILFPGWIEGWYEESEARSNVNSLDFIRDNKMEVRNVLIKIKGAKTVRALETRAVCYRPYGKIISTQIVDGLTIIDIEGMDLPDKDPSLPMTEFDKIMEA